MTQPGDGLDVGCMGMEGIKDDSPDFCLIQLNGWDMDHHEKDRTLGERRGVMNAVWMCYV